jgi:hypothetical protein
MRRYVDCVLVVAVVLPAGCGGAGSIKLAPVSGRVTLDSKPLANASVTFVPDRGDPDKDPPPASIGVTDADGRYSLTLSADTKATGAVVGRHKVMILVGPGESHDTKPTFHKQLPVRYNRNSELECDVPGGGRNDANFDLKSN